jgi:hypothetical protein
MRVFEKRTLRMIWGIRWKKQEEVGDNCIMSFMIYTLQQICLDDRFKKNEMGGAGGINGGEEKCIQGFGGET